METNYLQKYIEDQVIRQYQQVLQCESLFPKRTEEEKKADELRWKKRERIATIKRILRLPFVWAPKLVINLAYILTAPINDPFGTYTTNEDDHPKDSWNFRAGLK